MMFLNCLKEVSILLHENLRAFQEECVFQGISKKKSGRLNEVSFCMTLVAATDPHRRRACYDIWVRYR